MSGKKRKQKLPTNTKINLNSIILLAVVVIGGLITGKGVSNNQPNANLANQIIDVFNGASQSKTSNKNSVASDKLASLDFKSGDNPVVVVNHNKADLKASDWKTNRVDYQDLDNLNRTSGTNTGYLEKRNIADGSLRVRQYVQPTGWHQKFVDDDPIINRGHLMAYSISKGISTSGKYNPNDQSGDQNNPKNLFTQTAYSNQDLQTKYEQKVRNALYNNKKVIYAAQPLFRGNELMARGVHLQALSTDDSLNFNVYLFNVQPKVKFDYATGRSTIDSSMKVASVSE